MIYTWSKFIFGHTVTKENNRISFVEPTKGNIELKAEIAFGNYSLSEFCDAIADAMNAAGELVYTVTVNRATNKISIQSTAIFTLKTSSSSFSSTAFALAGFIGADKSGAQSYLAENASGIEYYPQFLLQSYVPAENWVEAVEPTINKSASGRVEMVRLGAEKKMEMEIKFITNLPMDGQIIKNNPHGLEDALTFFNYICQKKRFEFVPDVQNPNAFYKVVLESTQGSQKGTGFKLKELYTQNLPDIYETGVFQLRVLDY